MLDPLEDPQKEDMKDLLYSLRGRKGVSQTSAERLILNDHYYAALLVKNGDADGMVGGVVDSYRNCVRPVMEVLSSGHKPLAGVYMVVKNESLAFFADCTIHIDPTPEQLAEIALITADIARKYTKEKIRVAMISNASFGSNPIGDNTKMSEATSIIRGKNPDLEVDGEMQADVAIDFEFRKKEFPFSTLTGPANVFVFPNLSAANISCKLLSKLGGVTTMGPIIAGIAEPAHIIPRSASTREIIDLVYLTAHQTIDSVKNK